MFSIKYNRYLDDHFDRQYYGAKLKIKKFDTDEFQSIATMQKLPNSEQIYSCVEIKNVSFHYNSFNKILKNITMDVPQKKIYALLGASGCGKTTLLRIILGTYKPLTGTIRVFGVQPGTLESNIPGPGVGYMPQDLALFSSFTIEEILLFYGAIYGIPKKTIKERVKHYVDLLNLPSKNHMIGQLSGGQQRRVSLAVTMVHNPPLLILDEPTVGVDSLLRLRIWNYLEQLCKINGTTVIITTHYTEEARNSFRVGFIDSGVMLSEDNPQRLLYKYNCLSLEDVFLELCLEKTRQRRDQNNANNVKNNVIIEDVDEDENTKEIPMNDSNINNNNNNKKNIEQQQEESSNAKLPNELAMETMIYDKVNSNNVHKKYTKKRFNFGRLKALLIKNYILFKRNPVSMILLNVIPLVQVILFCYTFARNPHDIPIAVVNDEGKLLSNLFLEQIDQQSLHLDYYNNLDDAIQSIHDTKSYAVISFPSNFSKYFRRRFLKPEHITEKITKNSNIGLYRDNSHAVFGLFIYQKILEAFEKFIKLVGTMMGYNPRFFGTPIDFKEIVYGQMEIQYFEFISPGMMTSLVHGLSMLIGSFCVVIERFEGHMERGFVAGIKKIELVLSHIIFFLLPVFTQVILCIFLMFFIFETNSVGSLWEVFVIVFMTGIQGIIFGITLSIVCSSKMAALLVVFSIEMPLIISSGVLWPIESLPNMTRNIIFLNPLTLPIQSIKHIILRGWNLFHIDVMLGIISNVSYSFLVLILGLIFFEIFK